MFNQRNIIGAIMVTFGIIGLVMAMNDGANHINFIGIIVFGLACMFGAKHAKNEFHPVLWTVSKWELIKSRFLLWRL